MIFSLGELSAHPIMAVTLLILVLLTLVISSYLAAKRLSAHKARLTLVLVSSVMAGLSLIGLAIDIKLSTESPHPTVLITQGATSSQLEQLDSSNQILVLEPIDDTLRSHKIFKNAAVIQDSAQLFTSGIDLQALQIVGAGLSKQQWQNLHAILSPDEISKLDISFTPSPPPLGLVDITFSKSVVVGQYLEITGRLRGHFNGQDKDTIYELSLLNPIDEVIGTQRIKSGEPFKFKAATKAPGQWLYSLQLNTSNSLKPIIDETLAVSVRNNPPLRIQIKQSSPSFETRHFSNWASQFGTRLFISTKISKSKDITQVINFSDEELSQLSSPLSLEALHTFDTLILDGRTLIELTPEQIAAISKASKQGLGVLVLVDNELLAAWATIKVDWLRNFSIQALDVASYSRIPVWENSKIEEAIDVIRADLQAINGEVLVSGNQLSTLVAMEEYGLGNIALSLINNSHMWQTSGKTADYSHYWQTLIHKISKPNQGNYWLPEDDKNITFAGTSTSRCFIGNNTTASYLALSAPKSNLKHSVYLSRDPLQEDKNCVQLWPEYQAWYQLSTALTDKDLSKNLAVSFGYVYGQNQWVAHRLSQNTEATKQVLSKRPRTTSNHYYQNINKLWLWVILLLSLSVLWVERKLF